MTAAMMLDRVSKIYSGGIQALDGVSLSAGEGELLVLVGPSGCGKTTVLRIIAGLERPTSGEVWLSGQPATPLTPQERNIAMVFQSGALYPHRSVRGNLAFPLSMAGTEKPTLDARVNEIARGLGIAQMLERTPGTLSGGERQRVAMGRAIIRGQPRLLLMDEPLASLDIGLRSGLRSEIAALVRSLNLTTVYVTHDQSEALILADRVVVMRSGTVEDVGPPARVYAEPATAYAAAFLSSPPISLNWATVWIMNDDQVVIDFDSQHINLTWSHPRSESLSLYHAEPVIVGIRPEALTPARPGQGRPRLRGRVRSVDYLGHEWLAHIEVGFRPVDVDLVGLKPKRMAITHDRSVGKIARFKELIRPGGTRAQATADPGQDFAENGDHRNALLQVRLGSPDNWTVGQQVLVDLDLERVHFFDKEGRRIGPTPANIANSA
jgi:multiple sugar transport system ATP-binding protein